MEYDITKIQEHLFLIYILSIGIIFFIYTLIYLNKIEFFSYFEDNGNDMNNNINKNRNRKSRFCFEFIQNL